MIFVQGVVFYCRAMHTVMCQVDSVEFYGMEAERLKALAEVEGSVAVRQNVGVAFVTFDDASVASRSSRFLLHFLSVSL